MAPDGFAPGFLGRSEGWKLLVNCEAPEFELGDAQGLDASLRARLPDFDFPFGVANSKPVVVGKWYCPFMFVKEGTPRTMRDQMRMSMFYEMTLEQNWERIYACENNNGSGNVVAVDCAAKSEIVVVGGREAAVDKRDVDEGTLWFRSTNNRGEETSVGLNLVLVERMKWEQERVGCVLGEEKDVRVERREEYRGSRVSEWKRFGCYVLVERFVLKRMDGSLALTHEFKHTHQIRAKWE